VRAVDSETEATPSPAAKVAPAVAKPDAESPPVPAALPGDANLVLDVDENGEGAALFPYDADDVLDVVALGGARVKVEHGPSHTIGITRVTVSGGEPGSKVGLRVATR
jgi:hypothetical protein